MDERAEMPEKPDAVELPPLRNEIEFRDVHFGYANETRSVLRGVTLIVPAGKMVALVGESGGGKSTLTKLLPRFHDPSAGAVLWDGIDLRDARLASLRAITFLMDGRTPPTTRFTTPPAPPSLMISFWSCLTAMTP